MVDYVSIKGKDYPVRIDYFALTRVKKDMKGVTQEDIKNNPFEYVEALLYYALVAGCKKENQEMDIKKEDIPFLIDEDSNIIMTFNKIFSKATGADSISEEDKKKFS